MEITSQEFEQLLKIIGPIATLIAMALLVTVQIIAKREKSSPSDELETRLRKCERMEPRLRCVEQKLDKLEVDRDSFEREYDHDRDKMKDMIRRGDAARNDRVEG